MTTKQLRGPLSNGFLLTVLFAVAATFSAFGQTPVFQGQQPARVVDTTTKPIAVEKHGKIKFKEDGVTFSNKFDGARMGTVTRTGENEYTILITPENTPINESPWYAFQVKSSKKKEISVRMTYPEGSVHRYRTQISRDGVRWSYLDDANVTEEGKGDADFGPGSRPKLATLKLEVGPKPLWVSAQELQTTKHVYGWMKNQAKKKFVSMSTFGKSKLGKPLKMLTIGKKNSKHMMLVISRQHPPEVTGYFAMQAFVETLTDDSELSKRFRDDWTIYVVPLMNPDGVNAGHWRHNAGGIDLNRDWTQFNQPEGKAVSEFLKKRERETGGKFYFGIDFHSTWDDIYYPMSEKHQGAVPNLVNDWLKKIQESIPHYTPNIRPNERAEPAIVSRNYFLVSHNMEAIVFEIGDNTSREFIRTKGSVGAVEIEKLLLERVTNKAD
ncbi:MAG: M14 family metallopeptidase [Pyrinomonadaceae bacterium]